MNGPQTNTPNGSMQPPARNAFDRMSGAHQQTPSLSTPSSQAQNGMNGGRTLSYAQPSWAQPSPPAYGSYAVKSEPRNHLVKQESQDHPSYGYASSSSAPDPFKHEPSRSMPGGFQDDSSTASDSDIEIIPATAFRDNGRHAPTKTERSSVSGSSSSKDALQQALFGGQPKHEWMNVAQPQTNGNFVYPQDKKNGQQIDLTGDFSLNDVPEFDPLFDESPDDDQLADIYAQAANGNSYDDLSVLDQQRMNSMGYVLRDPQNSAKELKELLENIKPDVDVPPEQREPTPVALVHPLYEHQKIALSWMKTMESGNNKGGILADDMGLGKTITTLALIHSNRSDDGARKTTLVVGPVALLRQWDREFRTKTKAGYGLSTHINHGSGRKLSWDELRNYDVVFTTYGTLGSEYKRLQKLHDKMKLDGIKFADEKAMKKTFPLLGPKSTWYRIILDEAQNIKNKATGAARACCTLQSRYRFCLTGTPMMNNVGELYSLIHFLRIKPYNEWSRFQSAFGMLTKRDLNVSESNYERAMRRLQGLLKAILLRRTKQSLIDGKPIITLPPKTEELVHVVMDDDQKDFYTALETQTQLVFNKYMKAGTVGKNYTNVLVLLLRLRQACCHPHLIHDFEEPIDAGEAAAQEDLAKGLAPDVVQRVLEFDGAFECGICDDASIHTKIITPCGHDFCADCLTKVFDAALLANAGVDGGEPARCPKCRGPLAKDKIIDYTIFKKVYVDEPEVDRGPAGEDSDNGDSETESETESESEDVNDGGDLRGFVVPDDVEDTDGDDDANDDADDDADEYVAPKKSKGKGKKKEKKSRKARGKEPAKEHLSIAMLKKEATKTAAGRKRYMKYLRKNWLPSAKLMKCVELLESNIASGQKTIIFSQFVSLLDLLQIPIEKNGWNCLRYDGSMSSDSRDAAIARFTDTHDRKIYLTLTFNLQAN